jgi:hypothetical protein
LNLVDQINLAQLGQCGDYLKKALLPELSPPALLSRQAGIEGSPS